VVSKDATNDQNALNGFSKHNCLDEQTYGQTDKATDSRQHRGNSPPLAENNIMKQAENIGLFNNNVVKVAN